MASKKIKCTEYPQWFIEDLENEEDKQKSRSGFLSHSAIVSFLCKEHGSYKQRVSNHINFNTMLPKSGCPKCSKIKQGCLEKETKQKLRKEYPEWFINELAYKEDRERAISKVLTSSDRVSFLCSIHGVYEQVVYNHIKLSTGERTKGCPKCAIEQRAKATKIFRLNSRPEYPEWFINELYLETDKEKAKNKTLTYKEKLKFFCEDHGVYEQIVSDHIDYKTGEKKQGCPFCGRIKQAKTKIENNKKRRYFPEWFINDIAKEEDKQRALDKELIWSDKIDFICPIHGVYSQRVDAHIFIRSGKPNQGCPSCGISISKEEKEIYEFVKCICPDTERRNRTVIKNLRSSKFLELDIYIPSKKIAIEYNGSYWHGENYKKDKKSHLEKYQLCEEKNIRLITVFDKDWIENKGKVKGFLFNLLSNKIKIYGRKTEVKQIPFKEANDFYKKYHLKNGDSHFTVSYGLFYNGELVSAMSFSKPKFGNQKDIEWDLSRYCVKFGCSVIGGAEKLFQSFLRDFSPSSIITYSDNDYFTGSVYSKLGFSMVKFTDIPYYWAKSNTVFLNRQKCQVKILKEKYPELYNEAIENNVSNKEEYIMHKLGFYKVYRCGNKKWNWNNKVSKE